MASGWNGQKGLQKSSFHAVWPQLVVTKERANVVRLATVEEFEKQSSSGRPLEDLQGRLLGVNSANSWSCVFDISSVRGGSCRLPYNDKINQVTKQPESRPMEPAGVWRFHFGQDGRVSHHEVVHAPRDLPHAEWLRRGSVRLPPGSELTNWRPMKSGCWLSQARTSQPSGSTMDWRTRQARREAQAGELWLEEQRRRRRLWRAPSASSSSGSLSELFKRELDGRLDDPDGHESTMLPILAKEGKKRWLWSSRRLKGAIELQLPDGQVFVRGNQDRAFPRGGLIDMGPCI